MWRGSGGKNFFTLTWLTCCRVAQGTQFCQVKSTAMGFSRIWSNNNIPLYRVSSSFSDINSVQKLHTTVVHSRKNVDKSKVPVLNEDDLEESFVRGSGPGGQSVNKTSSACFLRHKPTGFTVKCHEERSLVRNRARARIIMITKLDEHFNGDMSVEAQKQRIREEKGVKAKQKAKKRQMMKQMWKEREGIE